MLIESEDDMQRAIDEMNKIPRASEIKIHNVKTKISVCTRDPKIKIKVDTYIVKN